MNMTFLKAWVILYKHVKKPNQTMMTVCSDKKDFGTVMENVEEAMKMKQIFDVVCLIPTDMYIPYRATLE